MGEAGYRDYSPLSREGENLVVQGAIDDGVGENVRSRFERHLRRFELLGVHRDSQSRRVRFVYQDREDRSELRRIRARIACLEESHTALQERTDPGAGGIGSRDLDQHRIFPRPERDLIDREIREERPGGDHVGSRGALLKIDLPARTAEGGDRGHPRAEESIEGLLDAIPDSLPFFLVRNEASQIVVVGTGVEAPGVEEMHVGVHVAGNDPLPRGIDDEVAGFRPESRSASDGGDAPVLDLDIGVREGRTAGPVEERSVQEDDARENEPVQNDQTILRGRSGFRCMVRS